MRDERRARLHLRRRGAGEREKGARVRGHRPVEVLVGGLERRADNARRGRVHDRIEWPEPGDLVGDARRGDIPADEHGLGAEAPQLLGRLLGGGVVPQVTDRDPRCSCLREPARDLLPDAARGPGDEDRLRSGVLPAVWAAAGRRARSSGSASSPAATPALAGPPRPSTRHARAGRAAPSSPSRNGAQGSPPAGPGSAPRRAPGPGRRSGASRARRGRRSPRSSARGKPTGYSKRSMGRPDTSASRLDQLARRPRFRASATACSREWTPSARRIARMWLRTVSIEIPSRPAICGVESPWSSRCSTSSWRGVRLVTSLDGLKGWATGSISPKTPTTRWSVPSTNDRADVDRYVGAVRVDHVDLVVRRPGGADHLLGELEPPLVAALGRDVLGDRAPDTVPGQLREARVLPADDPCPVGDGGCDPDLAEHGVQVAAERGDGRRELRLLVRHVRMVVRGLRRR